MTSTTSPIRYGSVCSGIEAASVAMEPSGWQPAWFAEIEPFPSAVLAHHWPHVTNLGDMTIIADKVRAGEVEAPDVLVGGTPCQAFSVAGLRAGLSDQRGQLTLSYVDLANAIDSRRSILGHEPCVAWWENVPGVLSSHDNSFGCFLAGLAGESDALEPPGGRWADAGCVFGPQRAVAWRILDAQYFGVPQRRRRVFVVASARDGFDPAQVLFEFDGVRRDSAPSREAGQAPAGTLDASLGRGRGAGTNPAALTFDRQSTGEYGTAPVASTMAARDHKSASDLICIPINTMTCQGRPSDDLNPRMGLGIGNVGDPQNTLTKGHSHAVAYVVHGTQDPDVRIEQAHTLGRNNGGENAVAYSLTFCDANGRRSDRPNGGLYVTENPETAPTLTLADSAIKVVSFAENSRAEVRLEGGDGSRTGALSTGGGKAGQGVPCVASAMAVRRLTPTECERLQAFPDGHTLVPYRGKPAADGPRYKALGNSMAVCCMRFIGQRIDAHLTSLPIAKMDATPEQSAGDCYGEVASC